MGWWSEAIMGGDTPLDYLGGVAQICGAEFNYGESKGPKKEFHLYQFTRESVEKNLPALLDRCRAEKYSRPVMFQVLGAVILWAGAEIPDSARDEIIEASLQDEWMKEEGTKSGRGRCVLAFVESLKNHKAGVRVSVEDKGLFQRIEEYLNEADGMKIEITEVRVIRTGGTDKLYLKTTLPEGCYPFKGMMNLTGEIAHGAAEKWCRDNLGIEPEVIETGDR